jgi:hypothetical protein
MKLRCTLRADVIEDILVVDPYNAQVSDLSNRLRGARVETVDKFQGQEAPVVIYSAQMQSRALPLRTQSSSFNVEGAKASYATTNKQSATYLVHEKLLG